MSSQDRLLSDEELHQKIVCAMGGCIGSHKNYLYEQLKSELDTNKETHEMADNIMRLINTQKRLYAESELSKLKHKASYDPSGSSPVINPREIDAAIAEQRRRIK